MPPGEGMAQRGQGDAMRGNAVLQSWHSNRTFALGPGGRPHKWQSWSSSARPHAATAARKKDCCMIKQMLNYGRVLI